MTDSATRDRRSGHLLEPIDRVPGDPSTTAWRRLARARQSKWREAHGYPIGSVPYDGRPSGRLLGSRIALEFARSSGANFLTPAIRQAVVRRLSQPERHETLNASRLWADLLSSMPMCFNLFGDLQADESAVARAVRTWWPELPPGRSTLRFEHSPGRRDPAFLDNRTSFDAMFEVCDAQTGCSVVGIETKYHEHAQKEVRPVRQRCLDVAERSQVFRDGWREQILGTELQQIWLDHLLVLSMLQHPSRRWARGRFVLVYPSENPSFAAASARYRSLLRVPETFEARTLESLIDAPGVLDPATADLLRDRYL